MSPALVAACLWAVAAACAAMLPSRRRHWPAAWVLIVTGLPILGWVFVEAGPVAGFVVLAGGLSVLRWPALHLLRFLGRGLRRP